MAFRKSRKVVFRDRVGLAIFQTIARELREAGTLPRSPRFIWRAGTPHPPVHQASGADGILRDRLSRVSTAVLEYSVSEAVTQLRMSRRQPQK
eukprot:scaffold27724_cov40-Phaeocystis_antarctica.AAC.1